MTSTTATSRRVRFAPRRAATLTVTSDPKIDTPDSVGAGTIALIVAPIIPLTTATVMLAAYLIAGAP